MDNKQIPETEDPRFQPDNVLQPEEEVSVSFGDASVCETCPETSSSETVSDTPDHETLIQPPVDDGIAAAEDDLACQNGTQTAEPEQTFAKSDLEEPDPDDWEQTEEQILESFPVEPPVDRDFREESQEGEEFNELLNAPKEEPTVPSHNRPVRKGRPKRKKGEGFFGIPNLISTCVWLALIVAIGVTLGRMLWICAADVLAFGKEDKPVTVTVYQSDTIEDITEKLHQAGLVDYPGLFKLYADLAVDEGEIQPGIWDLNTRYDYHALVNMMSASSRREVIEVLIPEGFTCAQIFQLLEENKVCTARDLAAWAANGELNDYWFLEGIERGKDTCLEGYLFPDTYEFYKNDSPRNVLQRMLNNFDNRFTEEMAAQLDTLNQNVTGNTFTIREAIIVASLIEKETSSNEESPMIASVIYNRLFNWGSTPPYLNIDASIVYALGGKTNLTTEDLKIDSPYNTYTNTGLTPGPISNPGLASIKAALNPAKSNYYFYVLDPAQGAHKFSSTYDEHQAVIASLG